MKEQEVVIIAEAGVNHNGSLAIAKKLVDVAAESGADYVKFQTFKADQVASKSAAKAEYQMKTTSGEESQLDMLKKLELSLEDHLELIEYCSSKSIEFLSTPFDLVSIELLASLNLSLGKIPSGEITNLPYLEEMAKTFRRIIISTGMADISEIKEAIEVLGKNGVNKENITILHCNTEYPTPYSDVNLLAMKSIGTEFGCKVGYSDHTTGIEVSIAAVALGAVVIEKHFTLDRNMEGPDHKASLEPQELKQMVQSIRNIQKALGKSVKEPSLSESKNREIARKSLVAARKIEPGHQLTRDDLAVKRPGTGISPMRINDVIGRVVNREVDEDELILPEYFSE